MWDDDEPAPRAVGQQEPSSCNSGASPAAQEDVIAVHAAARADADIATKPAILRCARRRIVLRSGIEMGDISVAADDKYMP